MLRQELGSSTVITIAHRLEAVEGADFLVRLDAGKLVECGPTRRTGDGDSLGGRGKDRDREEDDDDDDGNDKAGVGSQKQDSGQNQ